MVSTRSVGGIMIGNDVKLDIEKSNDNRSYHISSGKIKNVLGN